MVSSDLRGKQFLNITKHLVREYYLTIDVLCDRCKTSCEEGNGLAWHLFYLWNEASNTTDYVSATHWFSEKLRNHPDCIMAKVLRSVAFLHAHKFQECIDECSTLLVQYGNIESILFIRAIASLELGKTDLATADVKAIISEYANDPDTDDLEQALERFGLLVTGLRECGRNDLINAVEQTLAALDIKRLE
jgi:hypothetical protein